MQYMDLTSLKRRALEFGLFGRLDDAARQLRFAGDKRVIIAVSRGGYYGANMPTASFEHLETYLRAVFSFIGVTKLEFIPADGVQVGPEHREKAVAGALQAASALNAA